MWSRLEQRDSKTPIASINVNFMTHNILDNSAIHGGAIYC